MLKGWVWRNRFLIECSLQTNRIKDWFAEWNTGDKGRIYMICTTELHKSPNCMKRSDEKTQERNGSKWNCSVVENGIWHLVLGELL